MLKDYSLPFLSHQTYILPCEQIKKIWFNVEGGSKLDYTTAAEIA